MTTEEDFRRAIETNPEDWQLLLVFSDWLREREDGRADGYDCMGKNRMYPDWFYRNPIVKVWCYPFPNAFCVWGEHCRLPLDWYSELYMHKADGWTAEYVGVVRAFDDAAIAFSRLPTERQQELLTADKVTMK
jgi:uncharacterized protein (TIGR02996 family)